ncbi:MAG: MBL fold metallo-hydrolase, partial [Bacteroidales bacterium]
ECIIIDPAFIEPSEHKTFKTFIEEQGLYPVMLINTHGHIDHVSGNSFIEETYGLSPAIHRDGQSILDSAPEQGAIMGFPPMKNPAPQQYLSDGEIIQLGSDRIEVRYTPGHADGSISLVLHNERTVLSGDVLFAEGVGRADLPTGNMETLQKSIKEKLFVLPDDFTVYPGHGPVTTIKHEKTHNPFL